MNNDSNVGNVWAIPDAAPYLRRNFLNIKWNCMSKKIFAHIAENTNLSVYRWLSSLNTNDNTLVVYLYNKEQLLTQLKFCGLKLIDHNCDLLDENFEDIIHIVEISYDTLEMGNASPIENDVKSNRECTCDEEWQVTTFTEVNPN